VLLDDIRTDLLLSCGPETGNDLLAHYNMVNKAWDCTARAA